MGHQPTGLLVLYITVSLGRPMDRRYPESLLAVPLVASEVLVSYTEQTGS